MAEHFYQGEDISLAITIFEDEAMTIPSNLASTEVEMLLYTKYNGFELKASTIKSDGVVDIKRLSDTHLCAIIPASATTLLEPGTLTIEMMMIDKISSTKRISVSSSVKIEPSKIGKQNTI